MPTRRTCAAATASPYATAAAMDVLRGGGNAIDAAVAAAWVLCVVEPSGSGLGGQTTALVRLSDGRIRVVDGHSYAPRRVTRTRVSRAQQIVGPRACTVPSTPATLDYLVRRFGSASPASLIAPAVRAASHGFEVSPLYARQLAWTAHILARDPAARRLVLPAGRPPRPGERQRFPELAETLYALALDGVADFYTGRTARLIAADMRARRGLLDERDLGHFSGPIERDPVVSARGEHLVWTAPAPAGGGTLLRALELSRQLAESPAMDRYERRALATFGAFAEREGVRVSGAAAAFVGAAEGPGETTHLTVADADGNVVSLTQSIQSLFGAKIANGELGFFYNNYLVTCPRRPHPARLGSRCAARSNVSPCLVTRDDDQRAPVLALGAAGSRRITSSILGAIEDVLDRGQSMQRALREPRVHGLLTGKVWIERPAANRRRVRHLQSRFADVLVKQRHDYSMGCVQAIHWPAGGDVEAAADPRRDGVAAVSVSER